MEKGWKRSVGILLIIAILSITFLPVSAYANNSTVKPKAAIMLGKYKELKGYKDFPQYLKQKVSNILCDNTTFIGLKGSNSYFRKGNTFIGLNDEEIVVGERVSENVVLLNGIDSIRFSRETINETVLDAQEVIVDEDSNIIAPLNTGLGWHEVSTYYATGPWTYIDTIYTNVQLERQIKALTALAISIALAAVGLPLLGSITATIGLALYTWPSAQDASILKITTKRYKDARNYPYRKYTHYAYGKDINGNLVYLGTKSIYYGY